MSKNYPLLRLHLEAFLSEEAKKTGLNRVVCGLSGGIDSAVVAVLAHAVFGDDFLAVMMPSHYSSQNSIDDATSLAKQFGMRYEVVSIAPMLQVYEQSTQNPTKLRIGNLSARLRMSMLYDISARDNALVLGTSNKSELLLGYGTIHGDLASAINPIGDLYKSEIFEFAAYLGVDAAILTKKPSADLWEGQSDEEDLGYSYAMIDAVLRELVEMRRSKAELLERGYDATLVAMATKRMYQNQFKRKQPLIAKVTSRSIGHDFLYPRDIKL